jgi:hypothetical protein
MVPDMAPASRTSAVDQCVRYALSPVFYLSLRGISMEAEARLILAIRPARVSVTSFISGNFQNLFRASEPEHAGLLFYIDNAPTSVPV